MASLKSDQREGESFHAGPNPTNLDHQEIEVPQADHKPTTRRALFAAAPAIALAAAAAPALAAEDRDDAELLELGREWPRLREQEDALDAAIDDIEGQAFRLPMPKALYHRPGEDGRWYDNRHFGLHNPVAFPEPADRWAVDQWRKVLARDDYELWVTPEELKRLHSRAREIIDAWDGHLEAQKEFKKRLGQEALIERNFETMRQLTAIEERILALPARTSAGLAVKAQLVRRYMDVDQVDDSAGVDERALASLLRDLA
jgi:hypothetical protein